MDGVRMVHGTNEARFAGVREEFERNFAERGEVGAAVCVTVDGETVVDLWGGVADPATGRAWDATPSARCGRAPRAPSRCAPTCWLLAGELDFDAPVVRYWPEFAKNGKDEIPVRMLLNHQAGPRRAARPPSPTAACATGTSSSTRWPSRSRCGSRAPGTATTR